MFSRRTLMNRVQIGAGVSLSKGWSLVLSPGVKAS